MDVVDCGAALPRCVMDGVRNLHGCLWIDMDWVFCLVVTPPCGYWIKSSMTDRSGNDGRLSPLPLWIDESPITLCQRVRLQRKGVNALSFSSR